MTIRLRGTLLDTYLGETVTVLRKRKQGVTDVTQTIATSARVIITKLSIPQQIARTGQVGDQFQYLGVFPVPIPNVMEGDIIVREGAPTGGEIGIGGNELAIGGDTLSIGSAVDPSTGQSLFITDSTISLGVHEVLLRS